MSRTTIFLTLAALVAGNLALPASAGADAPSAPTPSPNQPPVPFVWTEPPESVLSAAAALRTSCAAWPMHVSRLPDTAVSLPPRGEPAEARACRSVLDADDGRTEWMLIGGALGAVGAGVAVTAYFVSTALLRLVGLGFGNAWRAAQARWSRRPHGWQG